MYRSKLLTSYLISGVLVSLVAGASAEAQTKKSAQRKLTPAQAQLLKKQNDRRRAMLLQEQKEREALMRARPAARPQQAAPAPVQQQAPPPPAPAYAAPAPVSRARTPRPPPKIDINTFAISYVTWSEEVLFSKGGTEDHGFGSFYATAFTFEKEIYGNRRRGFAYDLSLMYGQVGIGGTNTVLPYQVSNVSWFGGSASGRMAYRLSPQITLSAGPIFLFRDLKLADNDAGVSAISGSPVNLGGIVDTRMRLSRGWEIRQTIGRLAFRATTLWSLGIGYKF